MDFNRISANTLFHFTPRFENLLGMLEGGLLPSYCFEQAIMSKQIISNAKIMLEPKLYLGNRPVGIPMISFCDIRLSQISEHANKFGSYAIGLKKTFDGVNARKWKLNPVMYFESTNSILSDMLPPIFIGINNLNTRISNSNSRNALEGLNNSIKTLLNFIKLYEGNAWLKEEKEFSESLSRFYNEREWRYVPEIGEELGLPDRLDESFAYDLDKLSEANRKLRSSFQIKINPNDINYIIIKENAEMKELKSWIYSKDRKNAEELLSKILVMEQIKDDF